MTRTYKLSTIVMTAADNKASVKISRRGVITSVSWATFGLAGAGIDCRANAELSKSSVSALTQNDTPPNGVLSYFFFAGCGSVNSQAFASNYLEGGKAQQVDVGDTLYLHIPSITGTAINSGQLTCLVNVNEG